MAFEGVVGGTASDVKDTSNVAIPGIQNTQQFTPSENAANFLKFAVPGVVAGFADTVLQSLHLADENTVSKLATDVIPSFGDYYTRNKKALQTVGDLTGMFIPGMFASKLIQGGGFVAKAVAGEGRFTALESLFTSGLSAGERTAEYTNRALTLAKSSELEYTTDATLKSLKSQALSTTLKDRLKETVAFEAGVYGTMNKSQTLYPSEMSFAEQALVTGALGAVPIIGEGVFFKRHLSKILESIAPEAAAARNPGNLPLSDIIARDEDRDTALTVLATAKAYNQQLLRDPEIRVADAKNATTRAGHLNADVQYWDGIMQDQVAKLGKQAQIYGVKNVVGSFGVDAGHYSSLKLASEADPTIFAGTKSVVGTDWLKDGAEKLSNAADKQQSAGMEMLDQINTGKLAGTPEEYTAAQDLLNKSKQLDQTEVMTVEADGSITPGFNRKQRATDDDAGIRYSKQRATTNDPGVFLAEYNSPAGATKLGVTDNGLLILPKMKQVSTEIIRRPDEAPTEYKQIMRANIKTVMTDADFARPEAQTKILHDIGKVYHVKTGQLGKPIFNSLDQEAQDAIDAWRGTSDSTIRREWDAGDPNGLVKRIYDAYQPLRDRFHELADAYDGTVLLFRGQSKQDTKTPFSDIVSMTSSHDIAKSFGQTGEVIAARVPIDDIVMVVGGLHDEYEFIVKGNKTRTLGDVFAGSGTPLNAQALAAAPADIKQTVTYGTKQYSQLDFFDRSAAWNLYSKFTDDFMKRPRKLYLSPNDHFTRLDSALEIADRMGGDNALAYLGLPDVWKGPNWRNKLQFASLRSKYEEFSNLMEYMTAAHDGRLKLADKELLQPGDVRHMLNLPEGIAGQQHPIMGLFGDFFAQGHSILDDAVHGFEDIQRLVQERQKFPELTSFMQNDTPRLTGNNLRTPAANKPVTMVKAPIKFDDLTKHGLEDKVAQLRIASNVRLAEAGQKGAPLVAAIADNLTKSAQAQAAKDVDSMLEGQLAGKQRITTADFNARGNAALRAMEGVADETDRIGQKYISTVYDTPFDPSGRTYTNIFNKTLSSDKDLFAFNMYEHAKRFGWRLEPEAVDDGKGLFAFRLKTEGKDGAFNSKLMKQHFGRDLEEGDLMPIMTPNKTGVQDYTPLHVTEQAHDTAAAIASLGARVKAESDHLRYVAGKNKLGFQDWWTPPPDLSKQHVGFITRKDGSITHVVSGSTPSELDRNMKAEIAQIDPAENPIPITDHTMELYHDNRDAVFSGMINLADTIAQTGPNRGRTASQIMKVGDTRLRDMISSINSEFQAVIRRTRGVYFEGEYNRARQFGMQYGRPGQENNIWQTYNNTIFGGQALRPDTMLGKVYYGVEDAYDKMLNAAFDSVRGATGGQATGLGPVAIAKGLLNERVSKREFKQIQDAIGPYNPFKDVNEYMENTLRVATPPTMRKHMSQLTSLTGNLMLRMMDVGFALTNGLSLVANTPAVIRSLNKMAGEDGKAWASRIGAYGTQLTGDVAMFNAEKAAMSGMWYAFTDEGRALWKRAADAGYMDQAVAEMHRTISAPQENYVQSLMRKGMDFVGKLADKSEEYSRGLAFMTGAYVAKRAGLLQNEADVFSFANRFANQVIANYRPQNRPQIFQGAVGMPLGLFQTFVWNYTQRLFGYVENKQWKALATQYMMQAAVFGAKTVPGFDQYTNTIMTAHNGDINPVDALRNRFGNDVADLILYGSVSNIPKLFGADGVALFQRGDANIRRVPTIFNPGDSPVFEALGKAVEGVRQVAESFQTQTGLNRQRMYEVAANYAINRPIRGLAEMLAGVSVDNHGAVINNEVNQGLSIAYRLMGLRGMNEVRQTEAYYRGRAGDYSQQAKMERLRDTFRPLIRSGTFSNETAGKAIRDYVDAGGNPAHFASFLRNSVIAALVPRTERRLMDSLRQPDKMYDAIRLLQSGVLDNNDPDMAGG